MEPGCRGQKVSFCTTFFTSTMSALQRHISTKPISIQFTQQQSTQVKYYFISIFLSASNSMSREFCTKVHILFQPCDHTHHLLILYSQKTKMWETFLRKVHKSTLSEQKIPSIPWVSSCTYISEFSPLKATYALFFILRNQARRTIKIGIKEETSYTNLFDSGY